jgi:hypothetical protein
MMRWFKTGKGGDLLEINPQLPKPETNSKRSEQLIIQDKEDYISENQSPAAPSMIENDSIQQSEVMEFNEETLEQFITAYLDKKFADDDLFVVEKTLLKEEVFNKYITAIVNLIEDKYELTPTKIYREKAEEAKSNLEQLNSQVEQATHKFEEVRAKTNEYISNLSQIAADQLNQIVKNIIQGK